MGFLVTEKKLLDNLYVQESGIDEYLKESNVITSDVGAQNHCPVPVNHCAGVLGCPRPRRFCFCHLFPESLLEVCHVLSGIDRTLSPQTSDSSCFDYVAASSPYYNNSAVYDCTFLKW